MAEFSVFFQSYIPALISHRAIALRPACTTPEDETSLSQSGSDLRIVNDVSLSNFPCVCCIAKEKLGLVCLFAEFCCNWLSNCRDCCISSNESGEPQCVQADDLARSMGAPQLEQFTIWMFWRNSWICCGDKGWMRSEERRVGK